ncbi:HpcH/HpaI aldolase/citrate lyase family protein [Corynebacterium mendelii]|uniref:2-dehydro-3-deoxyglucarate aldolase n=1 Tax=Corynebacterium mendelii TaxID=2765362 RepID=A0A939IWN8_9CORY|nr:aldolase/citrate lyase family protein [Corynebacterium mendelii]MBN9643223.1 2-dehydro-3-deoxyglucarate aldolase [Corynebacterium mendelii]
MPFHIELPDTFTARVAAGTTPALGLWVCSGSACAAEIVAGSGCDWVLVDGEHSPVGLESVSAILRATAAYRSVSPVVRVPVCDVALIKQYLDLGAQNIMVPMIDTAEDAAQAVAAMHYPPRGVRGVGSALARSSRWNRVPDYLTRAGSLVSLTVQIESTTAVDNAEAIAATDGVDAIFIGPSDLAASMGLIGQQSHPDVLAAVDHAMTAAKKHGTLVGVNAFDPAQARAYIDRGADFINLAADVQLLARATENTISAMR